MTQQTSGRRMFGGHLFIKHLFVKGLFVKGLNEDVFLRGGDTMALTPMMRQYQDIKATQPDALLMFRLGDFYELFFDDAVTASRVLDITLTGRDAGEAGRIPMCGVPFHALDQYLDKLIHQGYRVAICEQVEDPKATKGLVRREVVRVVTPGTALSQEANNRFLASIVVDEPDIGMVFVDINTGEIFFGSGDKEACAQQIRVMDPIEILFSDGQDCPTWLEALIEDTGALYTRRDYDDIRCIYNQFGESTANTLGLQKDKVATRALALALGYIADTQKVTLRHLQEPKPLFEKAYLAINSTAMHHLEVTATARDGSRKGSLLALLDQTMTSAGSRLMKSWLERPLCDALAIVDRHEAVGRFVDDFIFREEVRSALKGIHDINRILARFSFRSANARDLLSLASSLSKGKQVTEILDQSEPVPLVRELLALLPDLSELTSSIAAQIVENPPVLTREGGMFREGVDEELDRLRELQTSGRTWLRDLEQQQRDATGIKSLKIGYNKVFGYYIEVSKTNLANVPDHYERRQTLANAERFILPELKEREADILFAEERSMMREQTLFAQFVEQVLLRGSDIQHFADIVAQIDVLASLAEVAFRYNYVRPQMSHRIGVNIKRGRHPVVETLTDAAFVPNDTLLSPDEHVIILTGPNMGGKSTYMRQTAVIVMLAQMGSFVPAESAEIGIVDQIFARIGAADDLGRGQSTFMVEMIELAEILRLSTDRSLVLLDEIGRGTSTYDGLSIAEAVLEELVTRKAKPLTMFATHYHELVAFSSQFRNVRNHSMAVEETVDGITFLHSVVSRPSDRSYGIQVARLAGLPESVIERAGCLLQGREEQQEGRAGQNEIAASVTSEQSFEDTVPSKAVQVRELKPEPQQSSSLPLFDGPYQAFIEELSKQDIMSMTPLQAMTVLHESAQKARDLLRWEQSN